MSLHTYTVTVGSKQVAIQAKKEEVEHIASALKRPLGLTHFFRQISGVVGEKESTTMLWSPFTAHPVTDEEGYKTELAAYLDSLPDFQTLTIETAKPFMQKAKEICDKHMPIEDARETKEQVVVRQATVVAREHERDLKAAAWRARWCKPEEVAIPEGMMAVYLEINFNDSDMMTDYFCAHHGIGPNMLLAIVPKQAEKQALARRVLESYPELAKLKWQWHTEVYSMGHGNYLESEVFGTEKQNAYDGRTEVNVWYEIQFNAYGKSMLAYKDYPGIQVAAAELTKVGEVTIRRNEEHNGIQVLFPAKPEASVLEALKRLGFRWSRPQGLWYARYSDGLMKEIEKLRGKVPGPSSGEEAPGTVDAS